eukprot:gb/GECG01005376.1/.p1 GENE.gb/GECG01005376.1/~~gb/GECG01005376.1/.p1  ORF type:complete len:1587 (+),score=248.33 gb/GECG01005376.1/:1-4761(+)
MSSKEKKKARKSALEKLASIKRGEGSFHGDDDDDENDDRVYDELNEDEYKQVVNSRRDMDDFVVDDEGLGYADDGEDFFNGVDEEAEYPEEFENDQEEQGHASKKRKKYRSEDLVGNNSVSSMLRKQQQTQRKEVLRQPKSSKHNKIEEDNRRRDTDFDSILDNLDSDEEDTKPRRRKVVSSGDSMTQYLRPANPFEAPKGSRTPKNYGSKTRTTESANGDVSIPNREASENQDEEDDDGDDLTNLTDEAPSIKARKKREEQQKQQEKSESGSNSSRAPQAGAHTVDDWVQEKMNSASASTGQREEYDALPEKPAASEANDDDNNETLRMYWLDMHEDYSNPGTLYLFGKTIVNHEYARRGDPRGWASICVQVNNLYRFFFVLPREKTSDGKNVAIMDVYHEVKQHLDKLLPSSEGTGFKSKPVKRKYAFEQLDVPREETTYLKVAYPACYPSLPGDLTGNTFSRIFGTRTSCMENFILKRDLMGPCWIEISSANICNLGVSWCKYEASVENSKSISCLQLPHEQMPPTPPLNVASMSLKTMVNPETGHHEVVMASIINHCRVSAEGPSQKQQGDIQFVTAVCQPNRNTPLPVDFKEAVSSLPSSLRENLRQMPNERALLSFILAWIVSRDPDVLVGHNIKGFDLDVFVQRTLHHKVPQWSRIGRLRRSNPPKSSSGVGGRDTFYGTLTSGRLLCDTYLTAKELLNSETSYALTPLVKSRLGKDRVNVDPVDIPLYYNSGKDTLWLANHTENDAWLSMELMFGLQVLPLTKQITNLAGNLWSRTLLGARAERIEYLFLHEFHRRKYIVPDKAAFGVKRGREDETGAVEPVSKGRAKAAYSGGLVLEPKKGLYDKYILLLDFNSLYPSIIQEYNICFTTVDRTIEKQDDDSETPGVPPLPRQTSDKSEKGVLPALIETLVNQRRSVKKSMKSATGTEYEQMDIRQKALKILANSMYGCLGFSHSRFFARSIAALVTSQGREILSNTVEVAEKKLGLDVIYGDTDSIMIYTNSTNYDEVIKMGNDVKKEINRLYRLLEIEIDGVYAMMLLLKKKKYAALVATPDPETGKLEYSMETKGLDLVRRDWCVLSKTVGQNILNIVLSREAKEDIVNRIHEELTALASKVRNGEISLSEFVITKGLNKNPKDYPDAKSQPHLQVALRLLNENKPVNVGDHVPYIVCKQTYSEYQHRLTNPEQTSEQNAATTETEKGNTSKSQKNKSPAERAFHPDEVERHSDILEVDYEWYLANQIHPPITRLCEPIEGTSSAQLALCLGLDPSRFSNTGHDTTSYDRPEDFVPESTLEDEERFSDAEYFIVVCTSCGKVQPFEGVSHRPLTLNKALSAGNRAKNSGLVCGATECDGIVTGAPPEASDAWFQLAQETTVKDPLDVDLYLSTSCLSSLVTNTTSEEHLRYCVSVLGNRLRMVIRSHIQAHMRGWLICDEYTCQLRTRNQSVFQQGTMCPRDSCAGHLTYEYPCKKLHNQLEYFHTLFDVNRTEQLASKKPDKYSPPSLSNNERHRFDEVLTQVKDILNVSAYHMVDSNEVFGYMKKLTNKRRPIQAHIQTSAGAPESNSTEGGGIGPLQAMSID